MSYQSADNLAALCSYLLLSVHNMGGVTDREESVTMGPAATRTLCERSGSASARRELTRATELFVTWAAAKWAPQTVPLGVLEVHLSSSGAAESPLYLE